MKKTLSTDSATRWRRRVSFFLSSSTLFCSSENRWSTPGRVGRKNGAFSGCFGGSFGLLRAFYVSGIRLHMRLNKTGRYGLTWMTSRLSSVCQRERGSRVRVTRSPSSCGGVTKTSFGWSCTANVDKASSADDASSAENSRQKNSAIYLRPQHYLASRAEQRPQRHPQLCSGTRLPSTVPDLPLLAIGQKRNVMTRYGSERHTTNTRQRYPRVRLLENRL